MTQPVEPVTETALDRMRRVTMDRLERQDGDLSPVERKQIIEHMASAQGADDLSDAQLGRIVGYSASVVSQVRAGKYAGDTDAFLRSVRAWLTERASGGAAPTSPYVATRIGQQIQTVCERARRTPCIGLIVTRSGAGKTAALAEYARKLGRLCILVRAGEALNTKAGLLGEIAGQIGVNGDRSTSAWAYREIRRTLAGMYAGGRGQGVVIVVDEATTLHPTALNLLRNIHDEPDCGAGVVLADTARLDTELSRTGRIAGGYEQLKGRVGANYSLVRRDDSIATISGTDVELVADSLLAGLGHKRRLPADSYKFLTRLAAADGGLHNVRHRVLAVHDTAEAAGSTPRYTVAELDYVAPVVRAVCTIINAPNPFVRDGGSAGRAVARRTA